MDFDDVIKLLIPKSQRKSLKRSFKKQGWKGLFRAFFAALGEMFGARKIGQEISGPLERAEMYKPAGLPEPYRRNLEQARLYQANIAAMAQAAPSDSLEQMRLNMLSERVNDWVQTLEAFITRTLTRQEDPLLVSERKRVPDAIKRMEKQLSETDDPMLRQKLERTLENRRKQLVQLEQAANNRTIAELKVENTLAQLGIIYSQLLSGQYMQERSGYERLSAEIDDEVHGLSNYLISLEEIQQGTPVWS